MEERIMERASLFLTAAGSGEINIPVVLVVIGCIILCSVAIIVVNGRSKRK